MPLRDYEHLDLPDGVTPEEANWYSAQRQRDIDVAVERATTHIVRRALGGFLILLVGLLIALRVSADYNNDRVRDSKMNRDAIVTSGRVVSVAGCNRDFRTISSLRSVLLRAQVSVRLQHRAGVLSDKEYERVALYYRRSLDEVVLPDCRAARDIVTADPDKTRSVPRALYPGGPGDPEASG